MRTPIEHHRRPGRHAPVTSPTPPVTGASPPPARPSPAGSATASRDQPQTPRRSDCERDQASLPTNPCALLRNLLIIERVAKTTVILPCNLEIWLLQTVRPKSSRADKDRSYFVYSIPLPRNQARGATTILSGEGFNHAPHQLKELLAIQNAGRAPSAPCLPRAAPGRHGHDSSGGAMNKIEHLLPPWRDRPRI